MLVPGSVSFTAMTMNGRCQLVPPVSQSVHGSRYCPRFSVQIGVCGSDGAGDQRRRLLGAALGARDLFGRAALLRGGADGDHLLGVGERAPHLVVEHGGGELGARDHDAVLLEILGAAAHPQEALVQDDDVEGGTTPGLVLALDGEDGRVARLAHLGLRRDGRRLDRRRDWR